MTTPHSKVRGKNSVILTTLTPNVNGVRVATTISMTSVLCGEATDSMVPVSVGAVADNTEPTAVQSPIPNYQIIDSATATILRAATKL